MREQGKNWVHSLSCFIVFWIVGGIVGAIIAICFEGKYDIRCGRQNICS